MKPFGYIDLAAEGKVESYDPPEALVSNFRVFRRVKDDRLVATMEVIPDSHARASIDVLKRAEKPGARRSILKAIKADSTTVPILRDTTITVEITDTAAMHIPFFQYAKKDVYRDLEARGTALSTILKKTVDLNAIRPTAAESEVPRETQREFDLVSDHPGVLFTTRRARFGKFYVGPTEDEDHGVALHGSLQEPVTIDIRSGLNFRKVTLPIGYDMVVPLHGGTITFDDSTGKPKRIVHTPAEFEPLVPPPDVPADVVDAVPGAPGGPPLEEPPAPSVSSVVPPSPAGTGEPTPPSPAGTGEPTPPSPAGPAPVAPAAPAPATTPAAPGAAPDEDIPDLGSLSIAEEPTASAAPGAPAAPSRPVAPCEVSAIPPSPVAPPGAPAPTDTNNLPTEIPTYLPTAPGEPLPAPPPDVEVPSEPAAVEAPPTLEAPGAPPTLEAPGAPPSLEAPGAPPLTLTVPIPGRVPAEEEVLPEGVPRYPPNLPFEPVPGAPAVAFLPREAEPAPSPATAPTPPTAAPTAPQPPVVRGTIDDTFRDTVLSTLTSYIAGVLNLQEEDAPIREALTNYAPLMRVIQQYRVEHPDESFVLTLPSPTAPGNWSTLPEPDVDTTVIHIVAQPGTFTFHLRAVELAGPRPTVSRVIVARTASFRMPPNEATRPYVRYIPDGKDAVIVARDAPFRMPPNESSFAYVKILA